jgi:hypothetical protein
MYAKQNGGAQAAFIHQGSAGLATMTSKRSECADESGETPGRPAILCMQIGDVLLNKANGTPITHSFRFADAPYFSEERSLVYDGAA